MGTDGFIPREGSSQLRLTSNLGKVLYEMSTGLDRKQFPKLPLDWKDHRIGSAFQNSMDRSPSLRGGSQQRY